MPNLNQLAKIRHIITDHIKPNNTKKITANCAITFSSERYLLLAGEWGRRNAAIVAVCDLVSKGDLKFD